MTALILDHPLTCAAILIVLFAGLIWQCEGAMAKETRTYLESSDD